MWIFKAPTNYSEMRNKISTSVFWITLIETFILTQASSGFSDLMTLLSFGKNFKIDNIELNIALLYLPIIISIIENIFKIHDLLGKIIKLRDRYSGLVIFHQYLNEFGINKSRKECMKLYLNCKYLQKIIGKHFYYHTSSVEPKIDSHNIVMALDSWCWVWIIIDSMAISILFLIGSIIYSLFSSVSCFLFLGLIIYLMALFVIVVIILTKECAKYSIREVQDSIKFDNKNNKGERNKKLKKRINNALQCERLLD